MFQATLPEPASEAIEALLARVCPAHPGTTVDYGVCEMCEMDERIAKGFTEPKPITPPWVQRANRGELPTKDYTRR